MTDNLQKILYYLLFISFFYSQEVNLNLTIVNSGKYSLSSFLDPNINLWQVDIFNNYNGTTTKDLRLEVDMKKDGITVIWGKNGSGKTSILEAIHSLSIGKSFKTNNKKELIKEGASGFFIEGTMSANAAR